MAKKQKLNFIKMIIFSSFLYLNNFEILCETTNASNGTTWTSGIFNFCLGFSCVVIPTILYVKSKTFFSDQPTYTCDPLDPNSYRNKMSAEYLPSIGIKNPEPVVLDNTEFYQNMTNKNAYFEGVLENWKRKKIMARHRIENDHGVIDERYESYHTNFDKELLQNLSIIKQKVLHSQLQTEIKAYGVKVVEQLL